MHVQGSRSSLDLRQNGFEIFWYPYFFTNEKTPAPILNFLFLFFSRIGRSDEDDEEMVVISRFDIDLR